MIAVLIGMLFGRSAEQRWDARAAERRWRRINEAKRAEGCPCGKPATHVRLCAGAVGSVPPEIWSCDEHVNVNGWAYSTRDPQRRPCAEFTTEALRWVGPAVRVV